jgi:hypothetical protein
MKEFNLIDEDFFAIQTTINIARYFLTLPSVSPQQIKEIGNALHALERLPKSTPGASVEFGVELIKKIDFKESRYVDFLITEYSFEIMKGGSTNDPMMGGGDSYSDPGWAIEIGGYYNRSGNLAYLEDEVHELLNLGGVISVNDESDIDYEG